MIGFLAMIPIMSLIEYVAHRWIMHRRWPWPVSLLHREHALRHHGQFYRQFDHEPDPQGRGIALHIPYWYLVLLAPVAFFPWRRESLGAALAAALYLVVQNTFHSEMHDPRKRFFSDWRIYRYCCRYHYLHHRHVSRNFNATLPLGLDWLLGTLAVPTDYERSEMRRMGYLS